MPRGATGKDLKMPNKFAINHPKTGKRLHTRKTEREYTHAVVSFERREWRERELARQMDKLEGMTLEEAGVELERREAAYNAASAAFQKVATARATADDAYAFQPQYSRARRRWEIRVSAGRQGFGPAPREATEEEVQMSEAAQAASRSWTQLRVAVLAAQSLTKGLAKMDAGESDGLYDWNYCGRRDLAEKKARSFDPARFEVFIVPTAKL